MYIITLNRGSWPTIYRFVMIVPLVLLIAACSGPDESPESRIRTLIEEGVEAGEDRSLDFFREHIDQDYSDDHGNGKKEILRLLVGYYYRNRSIHLVSHIDEISIMDDGQARAVVIVGMAGSPVEGFEQLLALRADIYRLELNFKMDEDIRLIQAAWRRIEPESVFGDP